MDIFGGKWVGHQEKIEKGWKQVVGPDDLVLIAGDISWAMTLDEVKIDLAWIDALPGTKVMIKGNHDYWWHSVSKVRSILPPSCHIIQNDAFQWKGVSIAGTRLWDTNDYSFYPLPEDNERERIYERELQRLEVSLKALQGDVRLVMTHYPPIGKEMHPSRVSDLLEKYKVSACLFGHLHNMEKEQLSFGSLHGIAYHLTTCDYLDFTPLLIR